MVTSLYNSLLVLPASNNPRKVYSLLFILNRLRVTRCEHFSIETLNQVETLKDDIKKINKCF